MERLWKNSLVRQRNLSENIVDAASKAAPASFQLGKVIGKPEMEIFDSLLRRVVVNGPISAMQHFSAVVLKKLADNHTGVRSLS